jgi:anti-sigma factor RsiW
MKNDNVRERVHWLLDGEMTERERNELLRQINEHPEDREAYSALRDQSAWLAQAGELEPPRSFTRQVMARLTPEPRGLLTRVREFLFRRRPLTWNMASAMAAAAVLIVTVGVTLRQQPASVAPNESVTVRLNFYAPQAGRVAVAGDFNRWQGDSTLMVPQGGGVWTIDLPLLPGTYSYMFVVDGADWVTDPDAETFQDDGFGNRNAVVRVRT